MSCGQCTRHCIKTHGYNADAPASYSFFKILVANSFTQFLYLPPDFSSRVLENKGRLTYLDDVLGGRWQVRISLLNGQLAFQDGWSKFVSDHSLNLGDLLIFTHFPRSNYVIRIYGTNSLERLTFPDTRRENFHKGRTTAAEPCKSLVSSDRDAKAPNGNINHKRAHFANVESDSPPRKKHIPEQMPVSDDFNFTRSEKSYPEHANKNNGSFGECSMKFDRLSKDYLLKKKGVFQQHGMNNDRRTNTKAGHDPFGDDEFGNGKMKMKSERDHYDTGNDMRRKIKFEPDYSSEDMVRPPAGFPRPSSYSGGLMGPYEREAKQSKSFFHKSNHERRITPSSKMGRRMSSPSNETLSHGFEYASDEQGESFETLATRNFIGKKIGHENGTWNPSQFSLPRGRPGRRSSKNQTFYHNPNTHNVPEEISDKSSTDKDSDVWQSSSTHPSDNDTSESEPSDLEVADDDDQKVNTSYKKGPKGMFPPMSLENDDMIYDLANIKVEVDEAIPSNVDAGIASPRQSDEGKSKANSYRGRNEEPCGIEHMIQYNPEGECSAQTPTAENLCSLTSPGKFNDFINEGGVVDNGSLQSEGKHTQGARSPMSNDTSMKNPNSLDEGLDGIGGANEDRSGPTSNDNTLQSNCDGESRENFTTHEDNGGNEGQKKQFTMSDEDCDGASKDVIEAMVDLGAINPMFADFEESNTFDLEDIIQSKALEPPLSEEHCCEDSKGRSEEDNHEENPLAVTVGTAENLIVNETVVGIKEAVVKNKDTHAQMADNEVISDDQDAMKQIIIRNVPETSYNSKPYQLERIADGSSSNFESSTSSNSRWSITVTRKTRLELPKSFPMLLQTKWQMNAGRIVVLLRDPARRLWPILYHGIEERKAFTYGWKDFVKANNIKKGDTCTFEAVVGEFDDVYRVLITPKS